MLYSISQFFSIDESGGNLVSLRFNALTKMNEGVYYYIVRESKHTLEASKSEEVRLKVSCKSITAFITTDNRPFVFFIILTFNSLPNTDSEPRSISVLDNFRSSATQRVIARLGEYAVLRCNPPRHFGAYPKFS